MTAIIVLFIAGILLGLHIGRYDGKEALARGIFYSLCIGIGIIIGRYFL